MGMEAFRETGDTRHLPIVSAVEKYVKGNAVRRPAKDGPTTARIKIRF
jgi:hypothetical protein